MFNISFAEYCKLYGKGHDPANMDKDFADYIEFVEDQRALADEVPEPLPTGIGRSKNINSNTDFTGAGIHTANTKHIPF